MPDDLKNTLDAILERKPELIKDKLCKALANSNAIVTMKKRVQCVKRIYTWVACL